MPDCKEDYVHLIALLIGLVNECYLLFWVLPDVDPSSFEGFAAGVITSLLTFAVLGIIITYFQEKDIL